MKKILENNKKTKLKLEKMQHIYIVACWAKYGVMELPFSGKYDKTTGEPLIYKYVDFNGTEDSYILCKISMSTCGSIAFWTFDESNARYLAEKLNSSKSGYWLISEKGCVIKCSVCGERLEFAYPDGTEVRHTQHCPNCGAFMIGDVNERSK